MIEYELFYLLGESHEADKEAINAKVVALVESEGGTFLAPVTEEKRKLAYEIKGEVRGTYIARRFTLPGVDEREETAEEQVHPLEKINRALQLEKQVARFMIVRADELPELKPIERVEKPRVDRKGYDKRAARPVADAPITPVTEEAKAVSNETIDEQLKDKLDI